MMSLFGKKIFIVFALMALITGVSAGVVFWIISDLPNINNLEVYPPIESSIIYSSDGVVLTELYIERRTFIPHYKIPDHIKKAFIAVEDQRFYYHQGVDIIGIVRALYRNITAKNIVEGGSTITQQLSKMLFLKPERNLSRKIKEAIISVQIERRYTKDEIVGMYLNQVYFGARAYGIESAAQTYFGKPSGELNIAETALLAGMPKAPSLYSPFKNPEKAFHRRELTLKKMLEAGVISLIEYHDANSSPLPARPTYRKFEAPYFIDFLRHQLEAKYSEKIYTTGYKIYSTIDYKMQKAAENAVARGISAVEKRSSAGVQAALVAIDYRNGHIKALVGGNDFWSSQYNRATMAMRQTGSAFKPFVYITALEKGWTQDRTLIDAPVSFPGSKANRPWSPRNYKGQYHGTVTLKKALALSLNTATVRLAAAVGIKEVIATAKRFGIKSNLPPNLPIALGAGDITLIEMVSAYTGFAAGSVVEPVSYEKVLSRNGAFIEDVKPYFRQVLSPKSVQEIRSLLRAVVESGTAQAARKLKRAVYGKTGTTNDFTDAWFIGFDDRLAVGVWVGRDDHKPLGTKESGSMAALPIWIEFMEGVQVQTD